MMVSYSLGFDMRSPDFATPTVELYQAALDMAEYADAHGVNQVNVARNNVVAGRLLPLRAGRPGRLGLGEMTCCCGSCRWTIRWAKWPSRSRCST